MAIENLQILIKDIEMWTLFEINQVGRKRFYYKKKKKCNLSQRDLKEIGSGSSNAVLLIN